MRALATRLVRSTSSLLALGALSGLLGAIASGCGASTINDCTGTDCTTPLDDGGLPVGGIKVMPDHVTLTVGATPAMQAFTAIDDTDGDVTAVAQWSGSDPTLGSVDATGHFTSAAPLPHGGTVIVQARHNSHLGVAQIDLVYGSDTVDPSAPAGATGDFGGPASPDPTETPTVVYPFDGTMLARNITQMNVQWNGAAKDTVYRLHFVGPKIDASIYVGASVCSSGQCQYTPSDPLWQSIALSGAGGVVTMTIQGTVGAGQPVATSTTETLNFSPDDVKGGLYYFSTSIRGIRRLPFGAKTAMDFVPDGNGTGCAGCHAISRDGKKVAMEFTAADQQGGMVDGANGATYLIQPDGSKLWNFESFSPDGSQMVTNWAGVLELRDGNTGALIMQIPPMYYGAKAAVMPEWSPDGNSIAFVGVPAEGRLGKDMGGLPAGDWVLSNAGSIMVLPVNGGTFGMAQEIVPSKMNSEYNFYPTWSPDSKWLVFATCAYPGSSPTAANNGVDPTATCFSYDQTSARLRLVAATPGSTPIELVAATHQLERTSTWPKFAPFQQGNLVFVSFSSKFAYGFVVPDQARPQLWMAGIDLGKAATELGAVDPSFPPFWLPFQDSSQNNHLATWTEDVACTDNSECPGEFICTDGNCVPQVM